MCGLQGKCGKVSNKNHTTFKKVAYTYVVIKHFSSTLSSISEEPSKHFKRTLYIKINLKFVHNDNDVSMKYSSASQALTFVVIEHFSSTLKHFQRRYKYTYKYTNQNL
jgi:hypothetical protein